eukprot:TRINITY_DN15453_c0_g1_i2.p1 TRINITY_DN15453_c0_g1~~TRINITY_DN15453_c0_g1_i2.p1  ORF type:complete len:104 (+),score=14.96 TRINITY_DN15453_c0_g1_i2:118-429(+)
MCIRDRDGELLCGRRHSARGELRVHGEPAAVRQAARARHRHQLKHVLKQCARPCTAHPGVLWVCCNCWVPARGSVRGARLAVDEEWCQMERPDGADPDLAQVR